MVYVLGNKQNKKQINLIVICSVFNIINKSNDVRCNCEIEFFNFKLFKIIIAKETMQNK